METPYCKNWYRELNEIKRLLSEYTVVYETAVQTADFEQCKKLKTQMKTAMEQLNKEVDIKNRMLKRITKLNGSDENLRFELGMLVSERYYADARRIAKALSPDTVLPSKRQVIRMLFRLSDQELLAIGKFKRPRLIIVPPGSLQDMVEWAQKKLPFTISPPEFSKDYKSSLPDTKTSVCIIETDPNPKEVPDQIPIFQNNDMQYDICRKYLAGAGLRLPKDTEYLAASLLSIDQFLNAYEQVPTQVRPELMILDHINSPAPTISFIDNGTEENSISCADITASPNKLSFTTISTSDNSAYLRARPVFELK